jgi:hypothetical protein
MASIQAILAVAFVFTSLLRHLWPSRDVVAVKIPPCDMLGRLVFQSYCYAQHLGATATCRDVSLSYITVKVYCKSVRCSSSIGGVAVQIPDFRLQNERKERLRPSREGLARNKFCIPSIAASMVHASRTGIVCCR